MIDDQWLFEEPSNQPTESLRCALTDAVRCERLSRFSISARMKSDAIDQCMIALHELAEMLVMDFRHTRIGLRELELQRRLEVARSSGIPACTKIYSPLGMFCRLRKGTLEIYWQTVTRCTGRDGRTHIKYRHIPRGAATRYNLNHLDGKALHFEKALVKEAELRAEMLRIEWGSLVRMRKMSASKSSLAITTRLDLRHILEPPV